MSNNSENSHNNFLEWMVKSGEQKAKLSLTCFILLFVHLIILNIKGLFFGEVVLYIYDISLFIFNISVIHYFYSSYKKKKEGQVYE